MGRPQASAEGHSLWEVAARWTPERAGSSHARATATHLFGAALRFADGRSRILANDACGQTGEVSLASSAGAICRRGQRPRGSGPGIGFQTGHLRFKPQPLRPSSRCRVVGGGVVFSLTGLPVFDRLQPCTFSATKSARLGGLGACKASVCQYMFWQWEDE